MVTTSAGKHYSQINVHYCRYPGGGVVSRAAAQLLCRNKQLFPGYDERAALRHLHVLDLLHEGVLNKKKLI